MASYRISYLKTSLPAGFAGSAVLVLVRVAPAHGPARGALLTAGWIAALPLLLIALSGFVVLCRDAAVTRRKRDLFHALNAARGEPALAGGRPDHGLALRQLLRALLGWRMLLVGDEVETRSFAEIRATLDARDCLDGLPFMPEMLALCGQRAQVFRRVDKIYDYGGTKVLRRMTGTVLLRQMRCSGAAHGGCQAGCYLMWKEAWLKPVGRRALAAAAPAQAPATATATADVALRPVVSGGDGDAVYSCQFTHLATASTPLSPWDARQDLRPWIAGNVTFGTLVLALLTRLFNVVQAARGGIAFPAMSSAADRPPAAAPSAAAGDIVHVLPVGAIVRTLDKTQRNRGLWFDRDMVKYCDQDHEVLARVDRIIDDVTGRMRTMKTPCIVLKDVTYSGEFLRFVAQEEHLYWREAWLSPARPDAAAPQPARRRAAN